MKNKKPKKHALKRTKVKRSHLPKKAKRRRRSPSKAHSKRQDKSRKKITKPISKARKLVVKPRKRKRKGLKTTRLPVKVQKVSRGKKQLRKFKGGHKRVSKKPVRKVRRQAPRVRKPQAYTAFNDDQGLKKLYRIDLRQRTYKEKVAYITRFNFWPMITEAENLYDNQFPFGFMCMVHTRFKDMELTNADKLSPIEEAIDDPALRSHSLAAMEKFKNLRTSDPRFKPTEKSDQLFKPVNIKALIIRFFYRTNK